MYPSLKKLIIIACFLFAILFVVGVQLAQQKPLWNDEIFTQANTQRLTYWTVLFSIKGEGNTCPLFYLWQKISCDVTGFKTPQQWIDRQLDYPSPFGLTLLRINPILFMSLSIVFSFYYFSRQYSLWAGLYSVLVSLSSFVVWTYWAEARPYAMWFFLTTCQLLLFHHITLKKEYGPRCMKWLVAIHLLLSLTIITSIFQIFVVSVYILWLKAKHRFVMQEWRWWVPMTMVPICICFYYASRSFLSPLWVPDDFMSLIYAVFPLDRLTLVSIYAIFFLLYVVQNKTQIIKFYKNNFVGQGKHYLVLTFMMILLALFLIGLYKIRETPARDGTAIPFRQFIFLTPVAIIGVTLFSVNLIRAFRGQWWMTLNLIIVLGGLFIIRAIRTYMWVIGWL